MLSYWFLTAYPLWITVPILYFLTVGILLPIRRVFEGRAYNHSFASEYGDLALIMVIMIGAGILERMNHVNAIMATTGFHMIIGLAAISIGLYWASREQWGPAGDMFHNLVSVPILIYFLCTYAVPAG